MRAYKNKAQCLADFSRWYSTKDSDADAKKKYDFTVQIAPHVITEVEYWNGHQIWTETKKGGRAVRRDKANRIMWVSPSIVFPPISGLSEFVVEDPKQGWIIKNRPVLCG